MAHVHIIDSGQNINCNYGTVMTGPQKTLRWTPEVVVCPGQTPADYDSRWIYGSESTSDFTVDGC